MPFAAALSEHPDPAVAVGEVTGQVLDALGVAGPPDLALLFVGGPHTRAVADAAAAVRALLRPRTLVGAAVAGVVGDGREVEGTAAISLWAGTFGPVHPVRLEPGPRGLRLDPGPPPFEPTALVLVADPFTCSGEDALVTLGARWPGVPVVGGLASAARRRGGNRLVLDGGVHEGGAVGALLGPGVEVEALVSQGARPVGRPHAVTAVDGTVVRELAGRPALERLLAMARDELTEDELETLHGGGLRVGRVIDERKLDPGHGDFLVREVVGRDLAAGTLALAEDVPLGETLQFHLQDADAADDDLRALLTARAADAALVFTDLERGKGFFEVAHHDAGVLAEYLGRPPTAGMFCSGEVGPVGGRNFVHGASAAIALLREAGSFVR